MNTHNNKKFFLCGLLVYSAVLVAPTKKLLAEEEIVVVEETISSTGSQNKAFFTSINAQGALKSVKTGSDNSGPYVELTFAEDLLPEFEGTPLKVANDFSSPTEVGENLTASLKETILDLGGNGLPFISSARPTSIKTMGNNTLRVGLEAANPRQVEAISYYAKLHAERAKEKGGFPGAFALFSNYSASPATKDNKNLAPKEETFFLFVENGIMFKRGGGNSKTSGHTIPYTITFHRVTKVMGVNKHGGQREYTDGHIAKIVGSGKPPFKPNGSFIIPRKDGKIQYVILSFDKAKFDPKTHDLTFDVTFLQEANLRKGIRAFPPQFMKDKPVKVDGEFTVFLDQFEPETTGVAE